MAEARLRVNGRVYSGWKSVRITRSIESIAGSFELEVADRWAEQAEPWAIGEEDACQVAIDEHVLVDGHVDRRSISLSAQQRTLTYAGRDRAAVLVDCSALFDRWTFRQFDPVSLVAELCGRFGIDVTAQPGLQLERIRKLSINPGDSVFQVIQRVAMAAGVLVVSTGAGGVLVTRTGSARAAPLVEGENILSGSVDYDGVDRFHRYVVATSVAGDDGAAGEATRIKAEAVDEGVRRTERVLMIRPEQGMNAERARIRGDWEARLRAARAETVSIMVHGWTQPDGVPWPVNALCPVTAPGLGVTGTMLISQVDHTIDSGGQISSLRLVRPDAFMPEPKAVVRNPAKVEAEPVTPKPARARGFTRIVQAAREDARKPRGFTRIMDNDWKDPSGGGGQ